MSGTPEVKPAEPEPSCATCKLHRYAERKPRSLLARLWRWHTTWCPGWKAYQRTIVEGPAEDQGR
jgi:hypothetical protein